MELILDTADVQEVKRLSELLQVTGVTTNPTIITKSGKTPEQVVDAEVLQCICDDRLVVRHNALHVKGIVKYLAKCVQRATKQEAGACSQHQKTNNGLEGSFNNVLNRLFLQD